MNQQCPNPAYPGMIKSWIDIIKEKGFKLTIKYEKDIVPTYEIFLDGESLQLYFPYRDNQQGKMNRFEGLYELLLTINDTIRIVKRKCHQQQ
jgi:hypothetical protein